jgi:hypothetical protein
MLFPITELLDEQESLAWVEKYFPPKAYTVHAAEPHENTPASSASTSAALWIIAVSSASGHITFILGPFEGAWRRGARARAQVPRSVARRVPLSGWGGVVARRWRPLARSLRGRDRRG